MNEKTIKKVYQKLPPVTQDGFVGPCIKLVFLSQNTNKNSLIKKHVSKKQYLFN